MLQTFSNILDRLIVNNDYNRILLFSGEDGFDFYDDFNKLLNQKCRILQIENNSDVGIKDIIATTNTDLRNLDTDSVYRYSTKNEISFLRSYEKNNDKTNKPRTIREYHRYEQKLYSKFIKFYM